MNFYITLTTKCNLQCTYCYGKSCQDFGSDFGDLQIDYSLPASIEYDVSDLAYFIKKDPEPTLIFYGGEPLLEIGKLKNVMDSVSADRYIIQTNGLMLNKLEREYLKRLDTILVSIDGDEASTDKHRGRGVYKKTFQNLRLLRENGFEGELIARMTISVDSQIDQQVIWLLANNDFVFTSVHWQLDALFWQNDPDRTHFERWSKEVYNRGVSGLVKTWVESMEKSGEVLRIYPLVSIMNSLLLKEDCKLRCGAGWNTFNIQTDGKITPCPVMAGMKDFYLGDIWVTNPLDLKDAVTVKSPCSECEYLALCGGRCLYANATKLWGESGFRLVCNTVQNLVDSLREVEPRVRQLISSGKINIGDFEYGRYNSCEMIP
ncbi:MAG: TIGR04084 family radical SAM/SPASM domain-containing protein [Candidatus Bathyarchaeota archaeon]|nr:TIGR04084 family radical SAM/SPASM domain-containing protein [Candidatus Bathyarchaeota archaeon]